MRRGLDGRRGRGTIILYGRTLLLPILRSVPRMMEGIGVAVKFPLTRAPMCDFVGTVLRLRADKCQASSKQCVCSTMRAMLGRPCAHHLSSGTRPLRQRLAGAGHFCPFPSRLGGSGFLSVLFAPHGNVQRLYICVARLLGRMSILCHRRRRDSSVFGRLCHRSLFGDFALIGELLGLVSGGRLRMHVRALGHLLGGVLGTTGVPFRNRPTVKVRVVKMLRAHGLSFHGLLLLSLGRNRLPGSKNRSSFVPCGLHGTFNVAAVRRGGTICTCCFCHLVRHTRGVALVCGASSSKLGEKR